MTNKSYEDLQINRPKRPFISCGFEEGALFKLCDTLTSDQRSVVPDLEAEYQWQKWWRSLTTEERKTIMNVEWRYD